MACSELESENIELKNRIKLALLGYNAGLYEWNMLDNSAYYSNEWLAMLGYENEEVANHLSTWSTLVHPDDLQRVMSAVTATLQKHETTIEAVHRLKHKNGEWIWILGRGFIQYDENMQALKMVGIHTNITEQKKSELEQQHLAQMIEQTHDSVISINLNGTIETWNRGSKLLFGYDSTEAIGQHVSILFQNRDASEFQEMLSYLLQNDEYHTETLFRCKDGHNVYVDLSLSIFKDTTQKPHGVIAYLQDITQRKQAEEALADSNHNLQQYLHAIDEIEIGLFVVNEDFTVRYMNNTMQKWFGNQVSKTCYSSVAGLEEQCPYCRLHEVINKDEKVTYQPETSDGRVFDIFATSIKNADGTLSKMEVIRDITTETRAKEILLQEKEILSYQANHDALTKLPNRTLFYDRLEQALLKAQRHEKQFALFFIDLDHFKKINDTYGHDIGDIVLKEVATRIKNEIRQEDTLARLSGDEFTLIMENVQNQDDPAQLAHKILRSLEKPIIVLDKQDIFLSTSIGISIYPHDAKREFELIKAADTAMYNAKETGRNKFKYFNEIV